MLDKRHNFLVTLIAILVLSLLPASAQTKTQTPAPTRTPLEDRPASDAKPTKSARQAAAAKPSGVANRSASIAPTIPYEKYKLPNGLEVIMVEDHRLPMVAVNLWYHVGPSNERPGRTGFAHLFEHMMFQGSQHIGDDAHFKILEGAGASDINGTTDFDRTNYFETLPSNQLELALWLESDRMGFLVQTLDQAKLANQRDVVRNERRQSVENQPYGLVEEEMFHQLFPKAHPYYASVIGSHADIEAAQLDDVRDFFQQYYAPNNASLAVVGDFTKAQAKELVRKYFGSIKAGPPVPKIDAQTPAITAEKKSVITDQVELPRVYMAWITAPIYKPGDAEADLIAKILGGGKSSRLYKKLVYDKQIAQDVTAQQYSLILGSVFNIQATAKPGVKPEELQTAIDEELKAFREQGPTPEEVSRARNSIESGIIRGLETLGGFGGIADRVNQYNHYLGDPGYLGKDLARYEKATTADLKTVAARDLRDNARVIVYGVKGDKVVTDVPKSPEVAKTEEKPAPDTEGWRKSQPKPGPASKLLLPVPQQFKLDNGLTVYLVEQHKLPIVAANLVVLAGSETNPVGKPGLASFTADMLDEGTQRRSTLQIAEDLDQIGATLGSGANADSASLTFRTLKKNVDAGFDILADVALNPAFSERELERVRKTRLTQILQQKDNPGALANKVFARAVFGDKHPYGFIDLGNEAATKAMTRNDLSNFWSKGFVPGNAALVVAGDITPAEVRSLATKYFGQWKGTAPEPRTPEAAPNVTRNIIIVDKPGSPQTQLRVGAPGIARSNADYVAIDVMNTTLGGLFSSRINMNLREKNGYSYGAFSRFFARRGPGPFYVGTGVRTDVTAPAVKEIFSELDRMVNTEVTSEELSTAKDSIARSLPGNFETTPSAAGSISELFVYSLPLDYYRALPSRIQAITAADVKTAAGKYIKPGSMVVVGVGDRAKIEPELKKLNLGPVEVRDAEGAPVNPKP
ncbi:MAG TPA: pitrilysin family protein [Terriglobales bacterium]|nr:pitrilysin family protein [Terriglobales bacterium]